MLRPLSATELAHADLKDGITLHQIDHRMAAGGREHETWYALAERRRRTLCWHEGGECTEAARCECYVVEKLGGAILDDVVRWLRDAGPRTPRTTAKRLGLSNDSPLEQVAEKVVAWGCAYPPLLT